MFKDIVLAITPSAMCENAVEKAISFAKYFEAKLYLLHVCGFDKCWSEIEYIESSGSLADIKEHIVTLYKEKLHEVPQAEVIVRAGIPYNEILRLARQKDADLIVMGPPTDDHTAARSVRWGMADSALERVSQRARCPVMIVTELAPPVSHFSKILVATDFSKQAKCAVAYAGQFARHYRAALVALHVLEPQESCLDPQDDLHTTVVNRLRSSYSDSLTGVTECGFVCVAGDPAQEILRFAQSFHVDCIIMAHHSKEADPEASFLGSTVVNVALGAECPIMSINRDFDLRCSLIEA